MGDDLSDLLFDGLNEQGFLFQEGCAEKLLSNHSRTGWGNPVLEYSVNLPNGTNKRVDILLSRPESRGQEAYAIIECKRANPDYSMWLFGTPDYGLPEVFYGVVLPNVGDRYLAPKHYSKLFFMGAPVAMNWMELRRNRPNKRASVPQTIEDAAIQVVSGTTAVANEQLIQRTNARINPNQVFFFPVIVTTARLYVANYRTKDVDLDSGKIARDNVVFGDGDLPDEEPWVLLNYPANPSLLVSIPDSFVSTVPSALAEYKLRSIYIVNAKHLVQFFARLNESISSQLD